MEKHTLPTGPKALHAVLTATLDSNRGKARERLLDEADVDVAVALVRRALRVSKAQPGIALEVHVDAGGVPKSYQYRAYTDRIRLVIRDGEVSVKELGRRPCRPSNDSGIARLAVHAPVKQGFDLPRGWEARGAYAVFVQGGRR